LNTILPYSDMYPRIRIKINGDWGWTPTG